MRHLISVTPVHDHKLICTFDNGVRKVADITRYLQSEVFKPLQKPELFSQVRNHQDYVEWLNGDVDLSADTLWHIGEVIAEG